MNDHTSPEPQPATDRTALREQIAEALGSLQGTVHHLPPATRQAVIDAVVPVLPEPADRAAVLREAAEAIQDVIDTDRARFPARSNDRAALGAARQIVLGLIDKPSRLAAGPAADTPHQTDGEAHPAEHKWAAELYDPAADEWVPGTRYLVRDRAVNALNHAKRLGPTWKDGTPTQRRLVRMTTTYTVEDAAPAVGGAQQQKVIRCDIAVMHRPHPAHDWTQRPDGPVRRCPGVAQAKEAGA